MGKDRMAEGYGGMGREEKEETEKEMITPIEKRKLALATLEFERSLPIQDWWAARLDQKIEDLKLAIIELERRQK